MQSSQYLLSISSFYVLKVYVSVQKIMKMLSKLPYLSLFRSYNDISSQKVGFSTLTAQFLL